jgi:hypothetical protein
MAYYTVNLKANTPVTFNVKGRLILVDSLGGASGVDITPVDNGRELTKMPARQVAFKFQVDYDAVILQTPADATVGLFLSMTDVNLGFSAGSAVSVAGGSIIVTNGGDQRVPVDMAGGTVNVNATNVGINNNDAQAVPTRAGALTTILHAVPAAINTGAAQALPADPTWKRLHITNQSPTAIIYIGASSVTAANAAIKLGPGESWVEDAAAGVTWYATSDTNGADVRVMGVK